jgi:hypothetical protein
MEKIIMKSIIEYLKKKPSLKGQFFDKGELKRLARVCGLNPEYARMELRKQGFILTKNINGIAVWKK